MANLRAPEESPFTRRTHIVLALVVTLVTLGYTVHYVRDMTALLNRLGTTLQTSRTVVNHRVTTWGQVLDTRTPMQTSLKCSSNSTCSKWLTRSLNLQGHFDNNNYAIMALFLLSAFAWQRVPSSLIRKNPGQGQWASVTDKRIGELIIAPPKNAGERRRYAKMDRSNPRTLYMGHFISGTPHGFVWNRSYLAMLRDRDRHENVMVVGAPGSGKTRGVFRQNIALDAIHGRTAIVYDLKWPQMDSGFGDLALYWHKLGRPVYVFAPFSETSMRLPLLDNINTLDEALKLARAIIAPPEYRPESGEHYKDNERRALAAMILAIAQSPTPTMKELQRLGQMNAAEITDWYKRQVNHEIKQALKAMFDKRVDQISDTLAGVLNKLQIFYNDEVSRATTAGNNPDEVIPAKKVFQEGGLIIIGIESKHIQSGEGEILLQLIKRKLDSDLMDVADSSKGGRLPVTATYYLDELPGLGRLPNLDKQLSQWRSKNVCMMLGVQNTNQGALVYGKDYWEALTTSNVGTRLLFVRGMTQGDAENLSREVGETTVDRESLSRSGHAMFGSPWSTEARKGTSLKIESAPMLSIEEIKRFPRDLAVVLAKGQNPAMVATPSLDSPSIVISTPGGKEVRIKNKLHHHWKTVMKGATSDAIENEAKAFISTLGVNHQPGQPMEKVKSAPDYWIEWLGALLDEGALARTQKTDDKTKIMLRKDTLPQKLRVERDLDYFIGCGWLSPAQRENELTITQLGLHTAGKVMKNSLMDFIVRGPALYWARTHMDQVNGYPGGATSGGSARYTPETLSVPPAVAIELYNILPDLPLIEDGGATFVQIPLSDPTALSEAISRAHAKAGKVSPFAMPDDDQDDETDDEQPNGPSLQKANPASQPTNLKDELPPVPERQHGRPRNELPEETGLDDLPDGPGSESAAYPASTAVTHQPKIAEQVAFQPTNSGSASTDAGLEPVEDSDNEHARILEEEDKSVELQNLL